MLEHIAREYNANKTFLSSLGLWPFQGKFTGNLLPILCLTILISYYPFEILLLHDHSDDARLVFEGCYQTVVTSAFNVRLWNAFFNRNKFRRLYAIMNDHWNLFTRESEVQILKDHAAMSRKFTLFYSSAIHSVSIIFVTTPLVPIFLDIVSPLNESRPRILPVDVEFRVDTNEYFAPIMLYTSTIIVIGGCVFVATDTMHFACTIHASGLFAIIGQQIENTVSETEKEKDTSKYKRCLSTELESQRELTLYREYVICLKKYELALRFVEILDSTHKTAAVFFLFLTVAAVSLVGVRIVFVLNEPKEMARFIFMIVATLLQLMIMCYSGQKVIDESQNVFYRAYYAKWYTYSPRLKLLLRMTLCRSFEPRTLTAGKLLPLSMTTFAAVLRVSMSYFTAFLSLKD